MYIYIYISHNLLNMVLHLMLPNLQLIHWSALTWLWMMSPICKYKTQTSTQADPGFLLLWPNYHSISSLCVQSKITSHVSSIIFPFSFPLPCLLSGPRSLPADRLWYCHGNQHLESCLLPVFFNVIHNEAHTLLKQSGQIFLWKGGDISLRGGISSSRMMTPRYEPEQVFQWASPTVRRP